MFIIENKSFKLTFVFHYISGLTNSDKGSEGRPFARPRPVPVPKFQGPPVLVPSTPVPRTPDSDVNVLVLEYLGYSRTHLI